MLRVRECSEKCNKVEIKVPQICCKVSQSANNAWLTIQKKVHCKQTFVWAYRTQMDTFQKKKVDNNRVFSYIFSIIILFLYWKYYSAIGTFCCPVQKSRNFAPIFFLLPVRRTIVHLENLT